MAARRRVFGFVIIAVLIGAALFTFRNGRGVEIRAWGVSSLRPVLDAASRVRVWVDASASEERIRALEEENRQLKASLFLLENLREENAGLRRVIGFTESHPGRVVRARVTLSTREAGREVLLLDRGEEAGIRNDAVVIDDALLIIGRVREAGSGFAKVDIASNSDVAWEAEVGTSRVRTVAQGLGARAFSMEYIPENSSLEKGALISARVAGSPLLLGEVATVRKSDTTTFQDVRGVLLADPARTSFVNVLSNE